MTAGKSERRGYGEGGIEEYETRQGPRWLIRYRAFDPAAGKARQFKERGFTTRPAAARELRKRLQAADDATHVAPSRVTLRAFIETRWLPAMKGEVRPSTFASYSRNLKLHVLPRLGDLPLQSIDPGTLMSLYADLQIDGRCDHAKGQGLSPRTTRYVHTILRSALQSAVDWDLLVRNPADRAKAPRLAAATAPDMRTWTRDELSRFLSATSGERWHPLYLLLATTGVRRGEALGLTWEALDLDAARMSVRRTLVDLDGREPVWSDPKTAKGRRSIALDKGTVTALRAWRKLQLEERLQLGAGYRDYGLVFAWPDGSPLHPERFSRTFLRAGRRHRLPVIRLHDLRHTWATLALEAGIHPKVVSERLGHANISITLDTYSHVSPAMQADAAERVAALILGSET